MKKQTIYMLVGGLIGLLLISAIIGLLAKSVILGVKIIVVVILLIFGLKVIWAMKALLETFFNKKD